jgi:hypothetical protein
MALGLICAAPAMAQPTLTLGAEVSPPNIGVAATITGIPGRHYALIGSAVGSGFTYAGVPLAVGPDVVILRMGVLDGSGQAVVAFTPPFAGSTLDRYYVQAATSTNASFMPLEVSPGRIVKNADLLGGILISDFLPPGRSMRGAFNIGNTAAAAGHLGKASLSFGLMLSSMPTVHFIKQGDTPPAECPGTVANPRANPGHLCIFEENRQNAGDAVIVSVTRSGAVFYVRATAPGDFHSYGFWAVAAP